MERPSKKGQRIQPKYAVWAVCAVLAYFVRFDWKGFVLGRFRYCPSLFDRNAFYAASIVLGNGFKCMAAYPIPEALHGASLKIASATQCHSMLLHQFPPCQKASFYPHP